MVVSILGLVSLLLWVSYTSIIAYEYKNSAIIVVDTTPSFMPYIILGFFYVVLKTIDMAILIGYKDSFTKVRSEQTFEAKKQYREQVKLESKKPKDEEDLRELVFIAIKDLGEKASITQIKKYCKRWGKLPMTRNGIQLNLAYLESLIRRLYLSKNPNNIFVLEPGAEEFFEARQQQREAQRQKEEEQQQKRQTQELLDNAPELSFCPQCDQYQIFENGRCPMCNQ